MSKPGRIPCAVLGCRRTAPAAKYEPGTLIICCKCWHLGSVEARKAYPAARREEAALMAQNGSPRLIEEARQRACAAWLAVKQEASEARAGIG